MTINTAPRSILQATLILLVLATVCVSPANGFVRMIQNISFSPRANFTAAVRGPILVVPTVWEPETFFISVTDMQMMDAANYAINNNFPDQMVPLVGVSGEGICTSSKNNNTQILPCAVLGMFKTGTFNSWLANLNAKESPTGLPRPFPFNCSAWLPCSIRTADPADGEVGGCSGGTTGNSDTLVVVTWNSSRYIFRPLTYFSGKGSIYVVPTEWPNEISYDGGLYFGTMFGGSSGNMCAMSLVNMNGTVEVFAIDEDDALSPTGLRRVTTIHPTNSTVPLCLPAVQLVPAPGIMSGPLLSVTCVNGEGWLWQYTGKGNATLVGHFAIPTPPSTIPGQPLVVDIAIVQAHAASCKSGLITAIALSGQPLIRPVTRTPTADENTRTLSFGVYISTLDYTNNWLTQQLVYNSTPGGSFSVDSVDEPLRMGVGWVLPSVIPAIACNVSTEDCDSVITSALDWVATCALYSAFTLNHQVLIRASSGQLAVSGNIEINGNPPIALSMYVSNWTLVGDCRSFTRLPTSALGTVPILLSPEDGFAEPMVSILASPSGTAYELNLQFVSLDTISDWTWYPELDTDLFAPTPVSLLYSLPLTGGADSRVALLWSGEVPLFYQTGTATQTATLSIGAGIDDFASSYGDHFGADNVSSIYTDATLPYLFVCQGETVASYNGVISLPFWTFIGISNTSACSSGVCSCMKGSTMRASPDGIYLSVVILDIILDQMGILLLYTADGSVASAVSSDFSLQGAVSSECDHGPNNPVIGAPQFVSVDDGQQLMIVFPMVGSLCLIAGFQFISTGSIEWRAFVVTGTDASTLSGTTIVTGNIMLMSETLYFGGEVYALDLQVMYQQFSYNPSAAIFGVNPSFTLLDAASFVEANGLIITATSVVPSADLNTSFGVIFRVHDGSDGGLLWFTTTISFDSMNPSEVTHRTFVIFILVRAEVAGIVTWACVTASRLYCVIVDTQYSAPLTFVMASGYDGPPSASTDRFLIWANEGSTPAGFSISTDYAGWTGLSQYAFEFPVNQTSCSDAVLANGVIMLSCALTGSDIKRLFIVDANTGTIVFGFGPVTSYPSVSLSGQYFHYVDSVGGIGTTAWSIQLTTSTGPIQKPITTTVCSQDHSAAYVLAINNNTFTATLTPNNPAGAIIMTNYSGYYSTYVSYVFTNYYQLSLDSLTLLTSPAEMPIALSRALSDAVLDVLTGGSLYIAALSPGYIDDQYGAHLMDATSCVDCFLNCPSFCTLNSATGEQKQYTARMRSIDTITKPLGGTQYNGHISNESIPYSGNVTMNLLRCQNRIPTVEQTITCQEEPTGVTVSAPSGRFCLLNNQVWSVVELVNGAHSFAASYTPRGSNSAQGSQYHGYSAWTPRAVFAVRNEIAMAPFFNQWLATLPSTNLNQVITDVRNVTLTTDILTVSTNAGNLVYATEACANETSILMSLPMCRSTFAEIVVDGQVSSVVWKALPGSNWGEGFISAGYKVRLSRILRDVHSGVPVFCNTNEESNPMCTVVCQPVASCASQIQGAFAAFLSLASWQPRGSTFSAPNIGNCSDVMADNETDMDALHPLRFYGSTSGDVIATSQVDGVEVVLFSTSQYAPSMFGVSFTLSRCVYFTLSNVVPQPFTWLAICAVKSLLLTFLFYFLEHRFRGRERLREAERDALVRELRGGDSSYPTEDLNEEQEPLNAKLGNNSGKSLVDRYDSLMARLCGFRHPAGKAAYAKAVRENVLYKDMDKNDILAILLFVLKVDRRQSQVVKSFAVYYELSMCNNRNWVVRQQPLGFIGSERLTKELADELRQVHTLLREVYEQYKQLEVSATHLSASISLLSTNSALMVNETPSKKSQKFHEKNSEQDQLRFTQSVAAFNELHISNPNCFEFAVMSSRKIEGQLQPSFWMLALSLLQSVVTVFLYFIDVYIRSHSTPLTALQMYECVCFMVFNSSLPSSLLVNAVFHVDLSPDMQAAAPREWVLHVMKNPFVWSSLLLLAPPLVTHVIPGLFLYCWALLPPIALAVLLERILRRSIHRSSRWMLAARVVNRIIILLVVSIDFSIAYNVADMYIWKWVKGDEPFPTGSYIQQHYFSSLEQDYDSRSLACVWEHLFATISNFLQMGFFLV